MLTREDIEVSKTKRGKKLFAALMRELHRRHVVPVTSDLRNGMRQAVAKKMMAEVGGDKKGVAAWAREAADKL